jgi:hypothetical protein
MVYMAQRIYNEYLLGGTHHLTAVHDLKDAWSGLGSSLAVARRQLSVAAVRWTTLLPVVLYLAGTTVLHVTTPALFSFQVFNESSTWTQMVKGTLNYTDNTVQQEVQPGTIGIQAASLFSQIRTESPTFIGLSFFNNSPSEKPMGVVYEYPDSSTMDLFSSSAIQSANLMVHSMSFDVTCGSLDANMINTSLSINQTSGIFQVELDVNDGEGSNIRLVTSNKLYVYGETTPLPLKKVFLTDPCKIDLLNIKFYGLSSPEEVNNNVSSSVLVLSFVNITDGSGATVGATSFTFDSIRSVLQGDIQVEPSSALPPYDTSTFQMLLCNLKVMDANDALLDLRSQLLQSNPFPNLATATHTPMIPAMVPTFSNSSTLISASVSLVCSSQRLYRKMHSLNPSFLISYCLQT